MTERGEGTSGHSTAWSQAAEPGEGTSENSTAWAQAAERSEVVL